MMMIIVFIVHKYGHLPLAVHGNKSHDMQSTDNNNERGSSVNEV